jgi:long-chain acyl-CoA synthetase
MLLCDREVVDVGAATADESKPSLAEIDGSLTAVGAPFEMQSLCLDGVPVRAYKATPTSLRALIEASQVWDDKDFIVYDSERWSFSQHYNAVTRLAHELVHRYKVKPGDRVAIIMRNLPEWSIAFWAITSVGAVVVPLNAWWLAPELEYALTDSGALAAIIDGERYQALDVFFEASTACVPIVTRAHSGCPESVCRLEEIVGSPGRALPVAGQPMPPCDIQPDDLATLFYTSGTTGRPKGALGTHRAACTSIMNTRVAIARASIRPAASTSGPPPTPIARALLISTPLFHVIACFAQLLPALADGSKLVIMYKWDPRRALELIQDEGITNFSGVPTMVMEALEVVTTTSYDLSTLRTITYGGSSSPRELVARSRDLLPVTYPSTGYGLTETAGVVASVGGGDYVARPSSAGYPLPVVDVIIERPDGAEASVGDLGQVKIRAPGLMRKYWNDPTATASAIVDGWYYSGDVGHLDEQGFLYIVDRVKDIIIRGGENIYSKEVENELLQHTDVADAAVIGLPHPTLGEIVAAVVATKPPHAVTEAILRDFLAPRLARYKQPARIHLRATGLPRNLGGKIQKNLLRAELVEFRENTALTREQD